MPCQSNTGALVCFETRSIASSARQAIDLLDAQDRWIVTQRGARVISTSAYIANVNLPCAYLEAEPGSR